MPMLRVPLAAAVLALAACNSTGAPEPSAAAVAPGATPGTLALPAGSGCAGEIGRFKAVVDNDRETGNLNRPVYDRIAADLDRASAACSAGRDAEASRIVAATRSRHGY